MHQEAASGRNMAGMEGSGRRHGRGAGGRLVERTLPEHHGGALTDPVAALAIVRALSDLLGIKIDYSELKQAAAEARERMKQIAAEAMEEYIDYFTEPIWEREEDEPEDG